MDDVVRARFDLAGGRSKGVLGLKPYLALAVILLLAIAANFFIIRSFNRQDDAVGRVQERQEKIDKQLAAQGRALQGITETRRTKPPTSGIVAIPAPPLPKPPVPSPPRPPNPPAPVPPPLPDPDEQTGYVQDLVDYLIGRP